MGDNDKYVIGWPESIFALNQIRPMMMSCTKPLTLERAQAELIGLGDGYDVAPVLYKLVKVETGGS